MFETADTDYGAGYEYRL